MKRLLVTPAIVLALVSMSTPRARADEVTDWNTILLHAGLVAKTSPIVMTRNGAIVAAAVFDAVNGIERLFTPVHVAPDAPRGASRRAAAVQAAYGTLVHIYGAQQATFAAALAASLSALAEEEDPEEIASGASWGQTVADAIWAWRSADGFTPPPPAFLGGNAPGEWRPTPPSYAPGAVPQMGSLTTWAIPSPSSFRPAGPPDLASARYAADILETETMGALASPLRSADQTLLSLFWNASSPVYFFDTAAVRLGAARHNTLSENARLLALLNIAMADAGIACWEAKYHFVFWRPITAIQLADTDGNSATEPDPSWAPLFATPAFPEYPSGHTTVSGAALAVLSAAFGEATPFSVDSDVMLGVTRSFASFSAALDEIGDARVFAGIHFRSACNDGGAVGTAIGDYVLQNALAPQHGIGQAKP